MSNLQQPKWIENPQYNGNVSEFSAKFNVSKMPQKAELKIVGLGAYKSQINGIDTDSFYYKPLFTDFDVRTGLNNSWYNEDNFSTSKKRIIYDVFDIKDKIKEGENELSVILGQGWYSNTDKDEVEASFAYGTPKLYFKLTMVLGDKIVEIVSDETVLVRTLPQRSTIYKGDFKDFTAEKTQYINAKICNSPKGELCESTAERDGVIKEFLPKEIKSNGNNKMFDFGVNHSGGVALRIKGKSGSKLKIGYFETLYEDGTPNYETSRWIGYDEKTGEPVSHIDQISEYVLSGKEDEILPLFHWNCYRYVEFDCDAEYEIISLKSLFISSLVKKDGDFNCSIDVFNRLYDAFIRTQQANMHCGTPTDCPHREKLGYTGDGLCTAKSVFYSFDFIKFYKKWYTDIVDSQGKNGFIPYVTPYFGGGGGCWWSDAVVDIPLKIYSVTGDKSILKQAYEPIKKYLKFFDLMHEGDYIVVKSTEEWLLGDWIAPEMVISNNSLFNTIAYYYAVSGFERICKKLGHVKEGLKAKILSEKIKKSINDKFFNKNTLNYCKGVQGENAMALYFGVVPKKYRKALLEKTAKEYDKNGFLDTGMVATPVLLDLLSENGYEDVAYKLMARKEFPSFSFMLDGETTLCEHWSKHWPTYSPDNGKTIIEGGGHVSHCHPVLGGATAWLTETVAGLNLTKLYKKEIIYSPRLTDKVKTAFAEKNTVCGYAFLKYNSENGLAMEITVPKNIKGIIRLPKNQYEIIGNNGIRKTFKKEIKVPSGTWKIKNI